MSWISSKRPKPTGGTPALAPDWEEAQAVGFYPVPGATLYTEYAELPQIMAPGTNDFLASYRYGLSTEGVMEVGLPSVVIPVTPDGITAWEGGVIPGPASVLGQG